MENEKILFGDSEIEISLTGKKSYKIFIEGGQGSFSIGATEVSTHQYDVFVNKNDTINWESLNGYYSLAGWETRNQYPYGNWPRFFYYSGNDIGFINWSCKRAIEEFTWVPQKDMKVDLTNAQISSLYLESTKYKVEMALGEKINQLNLCGNIENYVIKKCIKVPKLCFNPWYDNQCLSYQLPIFKALREATEIQVRVTALSSPFDCKSLLQFPNLENVYLIGNMTNLYVLKQLRNIKKLGIWDIPNLTGMPNLSSWENLIWFVATNIEENGGKILKKELSNLKKIKKFEFASIYKLRNSLWFETESEFPFTLWENVNERKATSAYKICMKNIKKVTTELEMKNVITDFIEKINRLENIESTERDDVYSALSMLMKNTPIKIEKEVWENWFDEVRTF